MEAEPKGPTRPFSPAALVVGLAYLALAVAALANHGRLPAGTWLVPAAVLVVGIGLLVTAGLRRTR